MAMARSSSDGVVQYQGKGAILGFSFPLTMQCMGCIDLTYIYLSALKSDSIQFPIIKGHSCD